MSEFVEDKGTRDKEIYLVLSFDYFKANKDCDPMGSFIIKKYVHIAYLCIMCFVFYELG